MDKEEYCEAKYINYNYHIFDMKHINKIIACNGNTSFVDDDKLRPIYCAWCGKKLKWSDEDE